jgi:hypothetical protein
MSAHVWPAAGVGSHALTAISTDNAGAATTSTAVSITVAAANVAPTVNLTSPATGASFTLPTTITLTATAADSDGSISKVEFYDGASLLGTATAAPYSFAWTTAAAGSHAITAKAYDNALAVTASAAVSITVVAANVPPTVSITSPAAGTSYTLPASVTINATASDTDGTVSKVDFYVDGALKGTATTAPYSYVWPAAGVGSHALTAIATDNAGATSTSAAMSITVVAANVAPAVSITSPAGGTSYTLAANVTISATATDSDGTVSKVEFYVDGALKSTSTAVPYSYTWPAAGAGSHALTAKAYDNAGAITTSTAVNITVVAANVAPTVSLTSPATGASFTLPNTITLTATAADSDGSISKVEFYDGANLLGTATAAPYSYAWTTAAAGSHVLAPMPK